MRTRHVTNNLATHQVSRAASATGLLAFSSLKSPGADAARLTKTSQRRGFSLVELMVVIAVITTLFSMVGVVFHRLFLSEQVAMRAALTERTVSRLADQFRRDVHAANAAIPEVDDRTTQTLKLMHVEMGLVKEFPAIVYSAREGVVVREQFDAEGKPLNREVYRLPECRVSFPNQSDAVTPEFDGVMLSLVIERQGSTITPQPQATRPRRSLVIEALIARDDLLALGLTRNVAKELKEESK